MGIADPHFTASDHIIGCVGQIGRKELAEVIDHRIETADDGMYVPYALSRCGKVQFTFRPARCDFRSLQKAIAWRATFLGNHASIYKKLLKALSPGLVFESLYNRHGYFPDAGMYNIYYQTVLDKGVHVSNSGLVVEEAKVSRQLDLVWNASATLLNNLALAQPNYSPAIHLHHSMDESMLRMAFPAADVACVDPSTIIHTGPFHHSFLTAAMNNQKAIAGAL
jgi:hypothetical protein